MTDGPPKIFNRAAYRARRARARGKALLATLAATHLAERLTAVNRTFTRALDLGSRKESFEALEPCARSWVRAVPAVSINRESPSVVADEEALCFAAESFDLVVSVLSLHAVNDLPGALLQIRRTLRPDGLFLAALFGGETLNELRQAFAAGESETSGGASPRVAPLIDVRDAGGLLQRAGFTLPVADVERTVVRYRDLGTLFADLRSLGETSVLAERPASFLPRPVLRSALQEYALRFADPDGRCRATFDIVYLTGWAVHESQQKPLAPGSAKTRLADALGTAEHPAGEKPSP